MEFARQEYWSGLPFPTPGDLSDPGIEPLSPESPALAGRYFTTEPSGKPAGRQSFLCVFMVAGMHSCSHCIVLASLPAAYVVSELLEGRPGALLCALWVAPAVTGWREGWWQCTMEGT